MSQEDSDAPDRDRPCVFFDRDGVVNVSPGPGYVLCWEDFRFQQGIYESLAAVRERGYLTVLVTSQKGVGKGLMTRDELDRIHANMQAELSRQGVAFDGIYAFTGEPDCAHRPKPDPEMIETACAELGIDPASSWMVGDADRDIAMGIAAGLQGTIRIRSENPEEETADYRLDDLSELPSLLCKLL